MSDAKVVAMLSNGVGDNADDKGVVIMCPACKMGHRFCVAGNAGPVWDWDGNLEAPTFSPSMLVRWTQHDESPKERVCHSYVRKGMIEFLDDCTHELAGKTVPLEAF